MVSKLSNNDAFDIQAHVDYTKIDVDVVKVESIKEWIISSLVAKRKVETFTYDKIRRFFPIGLCRTDYILHKWNSIILSS